MTNDQRIIRPPPRRVTAALRPPAPVDADGAVFFDDAPPAATAWQATQPALTLAEARDRFIGRYLFLLIGALLGGAVKEPQTVVEWVALATAVKRVLDTRAEMRQAVRR